MSNIDQFESAFRSAIRNPFVYENLEFPKILLVTDLAPNETDSFLQSTRSFLKVLEGKRSPEWKIVSGDQFKTTLDLLERVSGYDPDLICTYRNLHSDAWRYRHSLGEYLDVLLQQTSTPVLTIPHPKAGYSSKHAMENTNSVMVVTDHLTNDYHLINHAVRFTEPGGTLFLTHIEDQKAFARIIDAISRIPTIHTGNAEKHIREQLLKDPHEYIESCRTVLNAHNIPIHIEEIVDFGHRLFHYHDHIESRQVDLLVMNTKDDDQLAMNGIAYPLAVELRQIPLLML